MYMNQDISTPGIRLKKSVQLTKGDYELVVKASASTKETFFLWVFDSDSKVRISGTLHLGINKESLCLGFSLTHTMNIEVGILAHNNKIGDFCDIDSVEIKQQQSYYQSKKPISLEPNQSAILNNNPDHWK